MFQGTIVVSVPGGNPAQTTIPVTLRIPTLNVQPDPSVVRTSQAQVALNGGHFAFTATINQSQPSVHTRSTHCGRTCLLNPPCTGYSLATRN